MTKLISVECVISSWTGILATAWTHPLLKLSGQPSGTPLPLLFLDLFLILPPLSIMFIYPKWFNQHLRHNLKCLRTLQRKHTSNPTQHHLNKLNNLVTQLHADIAHAKMDYESKLVHDFACNKNPKLYAYIRSVTWQNHLPQQLFLDHRMATTDEEKVNLFNEYFSCIFYSFKLYYSTLQPSSLLNWWSWHLSDWSLSSSF